jgi:malate dehydrogenase (quinone)
MLDVMERCFSDRYKSWLPKLEQTLPSLGTELSSESALFQQAWPWGTKVLESDRPANGMPPAPADSDVHNDAEPLAVSAE